MVVVEPKCIGAKINQNGLTQMQFIVFLVLYFKIYSNWVFEGLKACDVMSKFVLSCMQYFAKLLTQNLLLLFAVHTGCWPSLHHQW